jgi:chemotaxis protein MotB
MAAGRGKGGRDGATIVVKRVEEGGHGHHGGAWKVAYADFVTAMMAFFLLMWLLNATSEEQRRGIADFFSPVSELGSRTSGSGLPFGGRTPNSDGQMSSDAGGPASPASALAALRTPLRLDVEEEEDEAEESPPAGGEAPRAGQGQGWVPGPGQPAAQAERATAADAQGPHGEHEREATAASAPPPPDAAAAAALDEATLRAELARREQAALAQAAEELRAAMRDDPALADLARQLVVEVVPDGLRVQILDAERSPMFALGSAAPNERARAVLQKVAQVAARLPNALAIAGHTDATPFRGGGAGGAADARGNGELSAERANAVRRLLVEAGGVAEGRIQGVAGHAERQPLLPDQPMAAANRRVAITLLRNAAAPGGAPAAPSAAAAAAAR